MKKTLLLPALLLSSTAVLAEVAKNDISIGPIITKTKSEASIKIINGTQADFEQFKFYVRLFLFKETETTFSYGQLCGASILDSQHILTAAHCVTEDLLNKYKDYNLSVAINDIDKSPDYSSFHPVEKVFSYPDYDAINYSNDIAIIKLKEPILTDFTSINIPTYDDVIYYEQLPTYSATGMGKTSDLSGRSSELMTTEMKSSMDLVCSVLVGGFLINSQGTSMIYPASGSAICAIPIEGSNICNGDSGGPLSYLDAQGIQQQIGVASYGITTCESMTLPSVFTEIYHYKEWIYNVIENDINEGLVELKLPEEPAPPPDSDPELQQNTDYYGISNSGGSTGALGLFGMLVAAILRKRKTTH